MNRGQLSPGSAPHDPVQESKCCDSLRRPKVSSSSGVRGEGALVFGQQDEVEIKFNLVSEVHPSRNAVSDLAPSMASTASGDHGAAGP